jgi:hypothetical protein
LDGLSTGEAISVLGDLLERLPDVSDAEWAAAIEADAVVQLLGLQSRPSF